MKELQYLNKYFYKYRYRLILGIVISVLSRYLAIKVPEIVKNSVNIANDFRNGYIDNLYIVKDELLKNISYIVALALLSGFFTFLMRQTIIVTSRLIEFDLKNEIFRQYERLSLNFYKKNRTGDLMNRISEDVSKVRMYFGPAIMYTINMLVLFTVAVSKMLKIDLTLTLYVLIPFPLLSISIFVLSKIINQRSTIVQEYLSKLTTFGQEILSGINVVKSYTIERQTIQDFRNLSVESKEKNINLYKVQAFFFPLMILLIGFSNLIVLYIGGLRYINGIISIGTIAEFIMYINMLTWPVAIIGWVTSTVQQAEASQKRINEFLEYTPEIISGNISVKNIKGNIVFKNVCLTYEETNITALKNINFEIYSGETVAFLGKVGGGKTSILNLILRFYDAVSGTIIIDGVDIKDHKLSNLRNHIGFVPQSPFLFSDSIANNIKFGTGNATKNEIIKAAKNASVHKNISNFKNKYKTVLGERGVTISGGQKQRISIARALIKNPEILIFDDCLSSVDTETEEKILDNLKKTYDNKTTIIASHRISSIRNADKIIIIDQGKIIEQGTHNELILKKGYYQNLYNQQVLEKYP